MKKQRTHSVAEFIDEDREWLRLTPAQRILETTKLWKLYIALGGSLDPEPDPQSPFYVKDNEEMLERQIFTSRPQSLIEQCAKFG